MDVDLEDGEDDVVEEALLGRHTFTQEASFRRYHKEPLLGVTLDFIHQQRKDPPIRRRSVV